MWHSRNDHLDGIEQFVNRYIDGIEQFVNRYIDDLASRHCSDYPRHAENRDRGWMLGHSTDAGKRGFLRCHHLGRRNGERLILHDRVGYHRHVRADFA